MYVYYYHAGECMYKFEVVNFLSLLSSSLSSSFSSSFSSLSLRSCLISSYSYFSTTPFPFHFILTSFPPLVTLFLSSIFFSFLFFSFSRIALPFSSLPFPSDPFSSLLFSSLPFPSLLFLASPYLSQASNHHSHYFSKPCSRVASLSSGNKPDTCTCSPGLTWTIKLISFRCKTKDVHLSI